MNKFQLPFEVNSGWLRKLIVIGLISWMAFYPIYTNYYSANAVETYERHIAHIEGRAMFFNPWQYRVLCPELIELTYWIMDNTVFRFVEIKGVDIPVQGDTDEKNRNTQKLLSMMSNPEFVKYTIIFLGFRFVQGVVILYLAYLYLSLFVSNNMRWIGLVLITLFMGNGVVDSDLTFNTYMDLILYLAAGLVIAKNLSYWWIVGLTVVGAFNRETSVFIPAIFFLSKINWHDWPNIPKLIFSDKRAFTVTAISGVLFVVIFAGIRLYYGYQPQESWRVGIGLPMLKLNLLSSAAIKTYFEFFGVFAIFPIWALFALKTADYRLKVLFYSLVPVWFLLHISTGIAFQTRLFLVPTVLVLVPMVLEYIGNKESKIDVRKIKPVPSVLEKDLT